MRDDNGGGMNIHDQLFNGVSTGHPFQCEIWEPEGVAVVIGYGQSAGQEVHLAACRRDGIGVIRRRGGGGAVVLSPGVLCLSCAFLSRKSDSPYYFFQQINTFLIALLAGRFGIAGLQMAGVSDIALNERKILGCSMFKSRALFFYQGSLLVHPDLSRIARYLAYPSREPDYRRQRGHVAFMTTLWQSGYPIALCDLVQALEEALPELRSIVL